MEEEVCENNNKIVTIAMYSSVKYGFKIEKYTFSRMLQVHSAKYYNSSLNNSYLYIEKSCLSPFFLHMHV